jgi:hypothetical protein
MNSCDYPAVSGRVSCGPMVFANDPCFLVRTGEFSLVHTKKQGLGADLSRQGKMSLSGQFGEGFLLLCVGYAPFL